MKCLYVGYESDKTGGGIVSDTNFKSLIEVFGERKLDQFIIKKNPNKIKKIFQLLILRGVGLTRKDENLLMEKIEQNKYNYIFFDGSLNGGMILKIKRYYKTIKIITFFHNIDYKYIKEKIKIEGKKNIILLPSVYYNEKLSAKYSDKIILLNKRDGKELNKIYKRDNYKIIPLSLKDRFNKNKIENYEIDYLFVGSNFFANVEGITWFIENVMPHVQGKLKIIGKGMECLKDQYTRNNVEIIGTVENVDEFYYKTKVVVCPIFSGSGMKTKTTEAMMFGKLIYGTTEAFEGFDIDCSLVGGNCNSKDEFIEKLMSDFKKSKNESRKIYLEKYSFKSYVKNMRKVFNEVGYNG
ncbi:MULTISPECIES: glycosyltransferase [Psychrilyobacter]|uniref:Glycosyltransferase n=1 Tax=Psychrilyobacter piezotolerans TaxID=2293438 RepID=A0ABX9KKZ1_9FUSO|nr:MULTISPECIES: glycosyltransferase [Psychrilyobacter]MCS5420419.1 glycosyltransferase family 4 protein [Psychrilyobacter sp. S5]NDI76429.1 glycosyltransferase family 4 protein [Psychrilyobacter piezotolerans]RDE66025.1 glycosyltransferase [Psychrilyobacter sp. S5]REI43203.1 glycosyltransferase [Psychrilyobacter piezotolerans]